MRIKAEDVPLFSTRINGLIRLGALQCVNCGKTFLIDEKEVMRCEPHGDGYYWCYIHCETCGYDNAVWKVLQRIKTVEK